MMMLKMMRCRKSAGAQNLGAHFARGRGIEMHLDISQEPLYTEIYRKKAAAQNHGPHFVRACAVETNAKISQEPL